MGALIEGLRAGGAARLAAGEQQVDPLAGVALAGMNMKKIMTQAKMQMDYDNIRLAREQGFSQSERVAGQEFTSSENEKIRKSDFTNTLIKEKQLGITPEGETPYTTQDGIGLSKIPIADTFASIVAKQNNIELGEFSDKIGGIIVPDSNGNPKKIEFTGIERGRLKEFGMVMSALLIDIDNDKKSPEEAEKLLLRDYGDIYALHNKEFYEALSR